MKKNATILISMLLILLFVYTAISKYSDMSGFQASLEESPLIGQYSVPVSYLLPLLELIIAVLLLIPKTRLPGLFASFWLMLAFTLYIGYMLVFTPDLPCSCGGIISEMTWPQHLIFNIFFTLLAFAGYRLHKHDRYPGAPPNTISYTYK